MSAVDRRMTPGEDLAFELIDAAPEDRVSEWALGSRMEARWPNGYTTSAEQRSRGRRVLRQLEESGLLVQVDEPSSIVGSFYALPPVTEPAAPLAPPRQRCATCGFKASGCQCDAAAAVPH